MQAPKRLFYVLDGKDGELISADKINQPTSLATSVDMKTGRPVETENARYERAHSRRSPVPWQPQLAIRWRSARTPASSIIPAHTLRPSIEWRTFIPARLLEYRTAFAAAALPTEAAARAAAASAAKGQLVAWDRSRRNRNGRTIIPTLQWRRPRHRRRPRLPGRDRRQVSAPSMRQPAAEMEVDAQLPVQSGPMSFEIDGEQYFPRRRAGAHRSRLRAARATVRRSFEGRIIVYKIGGKATLPPYDTFPPDPVPVAKDFGSIALVRTPKDLYSAIAMVLPWRRRPVGRPELTCAGRPSALTRRSGSRSY